MQGDNALNSTHTPGQNQNLKVFFYFLPGCPSCEKIKPYMNLMREEVKEVEFDFCDVSDFPACSKESIEAIDNNLKGAPTVLLINGENITVLLGWEEISRLGDSLNKLGIETPTVIYKNETYHVQDCVACHYQRSIPPPSTYTCTYCCHSC
jgi:thiol-disulfide isomerase/thioredoxin